MRIQKRITTVISSQTISKWWWIGAIRNSRFPVPVILRVALNQVTCSITETVSMTKTPPRTMSSSSVRVRIARPASAAPRASEPVSPMKICAGAAFHHRKPKQAPVIAAAMTARSSGSRTS